MADIFLDRELSTATRDLEIEGTYASIFFIEILEFFMTTLK